MEYPVEIMPVAMAEAEEAYSWLNRRSPTSAQRWAVGLHKAIESLSVHPKRCPLAPENDAFDEEIRHLLYGKGANIYRVLFTVHRDGVHILHVRHGTREPLEP